MCKKLLIIGGSAGALQPLKTLLTSLPKDCNASVIVVLHRQRNVQSHLCEMLSRVAPIPVVESEDKEVIRSGVVYLAPQNYHLLLEADGSFALDTSEPESFSRPSINVTMQSAAALEAVSILAILLSGANADGAAGMKDVLAVGGVGWVQAPETAIFPVMPEAALAQNTAAQALNVEEMAKEVRNWVK